MCPFTSGEIGGVLVSQSALCIECESLRWCICNIDRHEFQTFISPSSGDLSMVKEGICAGGDGSVEV